MFCKLGEYAPGIPEKKNVQPIRTIEKPEVWEVAVHDHKALKRGPHYDLRLGDPDTKHGHSWAMLPRWPEPGEATWAIQQPTHSIKYFDWEGEIPRGTYGAGKVTLKDRDKAEVVKAAPDHVSFNVHKGSGTEEYTLHRIYKDRWRLFNRTPSRESHPDIPIDKPKYRELDIKNVPIHDDNYVASAKIDDAHNIFYFPKTGETPRIFSYRESKRDPNRPLEHTHKVEGFADLETPKELANTIVRGGLYAIHPKTGKATPHHLLAGMLNSNVWKSRESQEEHGKLRPILYDVVKHKDKDMENAPYTEKLEVLNKIREHFPDMFDLPRMAHTQSEKSKLLEDIAKGDVAETAEGVVLWHKHEGKPPIKAKFIQEHDVYVREPFPGEGKYKDNAVGGFYYSHTPDGPIAGKIGTGLSDNLRRDMYKYPERYRGAVATSGALDKYEKSQALRAPAFFNWHLDKNSQERLDMLKTAHINGLWRAAKNRFYLS